MATFGVFVQKVFETNLNFSNQKVKILKNIATKKSTFKIDIAKVPLLFRISYCLVPKIEICIKYFSDKNSQN